MKLFVLRHYKNGAVVEGYAFNDKQAAKQQRDVLGGTVVVSLGPDHKRYNKGAK